MKFNTLRQYYDYHAHSGFVIDRRATKKHGSPQALGPQVPLEIKAQIQFPELGWQPRFVDLNRGLQRQRWKKSSCYLWIIDLIHFLYRRCPPVGPVIYLSEKWYEHDDNMKIAEQRFYDEYGYADYKDLKNLARLYPSSSGEMHLKGQYLHWFKSRHPHIYWNWQNQRWMLQISYKGRKTQRSYRHDRYVDACADLITVLAKIRNVPLDRLHTDPDLAALQRRAMPFIPKVQSARASALGLRRPETHAEALWRAAQDIRRAELAGDELSLITIDEFDAVEDHTVQARAAQLSRAEQPTDNIPEEDL